MDKDELNMILKGGEGYKIEFNENYFYVTFRQSHEYLELAGEEVPWLVEGLVENQKRILGLVKENPFISKREMADVVGISTTAVDKNIASLKRRGLLKRIGPAKGGRWEVVEK